MVLPKGDISLLEIATEFTDDPPHKLSEFYGKGGAANEGALSFTEFRGRSAKFRLNYETRLDPSLSSAEDMVSQHGTVLSRDGNVAVLSTIFDDDKGTDAGAIYVFRRTNGVWAEEAKLYGSDTSAGDKFGIRSDISGDGNTIVAVGPYKDNPGAVDSGTLYVFKWNGSSWYEYTKIIPVDVATNHYLGWPYGPKVSDDGQIIVVGSYNHTTKIGGTVYVYKWNGTNNYWLHQRLQGTDTVVNDYFGYNLAISGDGNTILASAHGADIPEVNAGAAYVFEWNGSIWAQTAKLVEAERVANNVFAAADLKCNHDGTVVLVSSYTDDTHGVDSGSVNVYQKVGANFINSQILVPSEVQPGDQAGLRLAITPDAKIIAMNTTKVNEMGQRSGRVYFFTDHDLTGTYTEEYRLSSLAGGEFDDGFGQGGFEMSERANTVIVGSGTINAAGLDSGAAYIFTRETLDSPQFIQKQKLVSLDIDVGDRLGWGVGIARDSSIVVASAYWEDEKATNDGALYLFKYNGSSWIQHQKIVHDGAGVVDGFFGNGAVCLSSTGEHLAIGAYGHNGQTGAVYLFTKNINYWVQTQMIGGQEAGAQFGVGAGLSPNGRILTVTAPGVSWPVHQGGATYLYTRDDVTGLFTYTQALYASDAVPGDRMSFCNPAMDAGGTTIVVGVQYQASGIGAAYVFQWAAGIGWTQTQKIVAFDAKIGDRFGRGNIGMSLDGGVLVITAFNNEDGSTPYNSGRAYVYTKDVNGWYNLTQTMTNDEDEVDSYYGFYGSAVSSDGNTLAITAHTANVDGVVNCGCVYIYKLIDSFYQQTQKVTATDKYANANFSRGGVSLNATGTKLIIGALIDSEHGAEAGACYVFDLET